MGIIQTHEWVQELVEEYEEKRSSDFYYSQLKKIGEPVSKHFPSSTPEEVLYHLQQNGLFQPGEWRKIKPLLKSMRDIEIWKTIEVEFVRLKKQWKGPDIPIYVFPITRGYDKRQEKNKNGLAIKEAVFLFLSATHSSNELKAILAHEYHHVCRMNVQKLNEVELRLDDLLVLEGTAEQVVKRVYGKGYMAPWTTAFKENEIKPYWNKYLVPVLDSKDHEQNMKLMYGNKFGRPPKWMGYNAAYHLVNAFCRKKGLQKIEDLFHVSAEEVIRESTFVRPRS
ncbi:hypothetical protein N780_15850 [Pontibacillus chungwhensis BH030062]|uniref:DUF2268 domain-containing protein n=1 Tax=Pontibacillus chungwhensis BH030062 TaxID=1385513 RepID=A0A0A2UZ06_9BACI|nr:DUF2268 domain-containing putative Zn-dependent protease [Pontibacillus chungwhensis]KGP92003.1 hypothetical protein N780_15850 [Pontibacillus chungwhensis BH030062]